MISTNFSSITLILAPVLTRKLYFLFLIVTDIIIYYLISASKIISGEVISFFIFLAVVWLHAINPITLKKRRLALVFFMRMSISYPC